MTRCRPAAVFSTGTSSTRRQSRSRGKRSSFPTRVTASVPAAGSRASTPFGSKDSSVPARAARGSRAGLPGVCSRANSEITSAARRCFRETNPETSGLSPADIPCASTGLMGMPNSARWSSRTVRRAPRLAQSPGAISDRRSLVNTIRSLSRGGETRSRHVPTGVSWLCLLAGYKVAVRP